MSGLSISWDLREPPLAPIAVLGSGVVARRLAAAVRPAVASALEVAASAESLLIVGGTDDLPWVDGARFLGREDGLLMPTTHVPSVPSDLVRSVLAQAMPGQEFAMIDDRVLTFPALTAGVDPRWLEDYSRGLAS